MDFVKVEGHDGLVRDETTGAILNLDDSAIAARRKSIGASADAASDASG